jgi:hypothetical protein
MIMLLNSWLADLHHSFRSTFRHVAKVRRRRSPFAPAAEVLEMRVLLTTFGGGELPVLVTGPLSAPTGGSVVLTASHLLATDSDITPAELVYPLNQLPAHAVLQLAGTSLFAGGTFTQQDVLDGQVAYHHADGGETTDSFGVTLSDGSL